LSQDGLHAAKSRRDRRRYARRPGDSRSKAPTQPPTTSSRVEREAPRELDIWSRADKDGDVRRVLRAARLVSVLLCAACAAPIVSIEPGARAFTPDDYDDVYERWTRTGRPFDFGRLSTVLNLTGTFESREFRWAYVVRYGRDFGLPVDARNALLAESLRDAEQHHRFFVTLGGAHPRELDLSDETGAWRVLLLDDRGRQTRPLQVERIRRPTPAERSYFRSISSQRQAFRLVFPVQHEDGQPTLPRDARFAVLRFTGSQGQVDLKWDFARP